MSISQLNKKFYDTHSDSWDQTRNYFWEGWEYSWKILTSHVGNEPVDIIDIGCGNGRMAEFYHEKLTNDQIQKSNYIGLDISKNLLLKAEKKVIKLSPQFKNYFLEYSDLAKPNFIEKIYQNKEVENQTCIINFIAVSHHIPNLENLTHIFDEIKLISNKYENAFCVISNWNFLENKKIQKKLKKISDNYYQLDWKGDFQTPRTLHFHEEKEITGYFKENTYNKLAQYRADGYNNYLIFSIINKNA